MKLAAFSFLDAKVGVFSPPFFFLHRGQALRAAQELANDQGTTIGRHPADFVLYELGIFDDQTGALETITPVSLGPCTQFLAPQRPLPFLDPETQVVVTKEANDRA